MHCTVTQIYTVIFFNQVLDSVEYTAIFTEIEILVSRVCWLITNLTILKGLFRFGPLYVKAMKNYATYLQYLKFGQKCPLLLL